jgi:hypothetical protein
MNPIFIPVVLILLNDPLWPWPAQNLNPQLTPGRHESTVKNGAASDTVIAALNFGPCFKLKDVSMQDALPLKVGYARFGGGDLWIAKATQIVSPSESNPIVISYTIENTCSGPGV